MTRCPSPHLVAATAALTALATALAGGPAAALAAAPAPVVAPASGLAAAPAPSPSPSADAGFTWAVQPSGPDGPTGRSYFVYDAEPGQRIEDRVAITNLSKTPMTFAVYGADAFTTDDGGFGLHPASQLAVDVGSWAAFAERTYRVPAGERVIVPFQLTVPANASPGDHAGGVVASIAQVATGGGQRVNLDRRVAARIYLRVAGPVRPALQVEAMRIGYDNPLNPFGSGPVVTSYRLRNTGNVRLTGNAQVRVNAPFGIRMATTTPVEVPELLPGAAITVTEQINGVVPTGRLAVDVVVDPATPDRILPTVTRTATTWAMPWVWTAVLLAGLGWLLVTRLRARRRQRSTEA
ncbi:WxL protein peptidoglycan domain-containing protein [Micromonospora sp. CA-263727]|uniref:WxL protein peptidoglycan domain-containing protein n=1 Tax=Micromonospora sp. CA-263727 TaxID=3239967 RepID=UPI003D93D7B6